MDHLLPNATAEAVGFTIPARLSSRRDKSKRPSKHKKKSSLDSARDEIVQRLRGLSIENHEVKTKERMSSDDPSVIRRQALKQATASASTSSSSAPISQYRHYTKPSTGCNGSSLCQTDLKVRTFRPTDIPDSRNSPDISAHPANSLPESPVDPLLGSPAIPVHPSNRSRESKMNSASKSRPDPTPHTSLPPSSLMKHTEDTSVVTEPAPAVRHKSVPGYPENVSHPQNASGDRYHGSCHYDEPVDDTFHAPAQHFATGVEGKVVKIPDALGEGLEIAKDRELKKAFASMGWE